MSKNFIVNKVSQGWLW